MTQSEREGKVLSGLVVYLSKVTPETLETCTAQEVVNNYFFMLEAQALKKEDEYSDLFQEAVREAENEIHEQS